jgi:hypothetical protein
MPVVILHYHLQNRQLLYLTYCEAMAALSRLTMNSTNQTSSWPSSAHVDSAEPRIQALLFNIITIFLAAATLLIACLHLMHQRRGNGYQERGMLQVQVHAKISHVDV